MAIRKGLVQPPTAQTKPQVQITHNVAGRQVRVREEEQPRSRIATAATPLTAPSRIITTFEEPPTRRGLLVDATGKPVRGLSQATVDARQASTAALTERCTRCGEMRATNEMKTVVGNALMPDNPVRICIIECTKVAYKDPRNEQEKWKPQVPQVRFDRKTGKTFDAHRAGMSIKDLVNKDTYHKEREVDADIRNKTSAGVIRQGQWSGEGKSRVGLTVDASKARPKSRRR